jgi:hypothetical protein
MPLLAVLAFSKGGSGAILGVSGSTTALVAAIAGAAAAGVGSIITAWVTAKPNAAQVTMDGALALVAAVQADNTQLRVENALLRGELEDIRNHVKVLEERLDRYEREEV